MAVKVRERPKDSGVWWVFVDQRGLRKAKKCGPKKLANRVAEIMEANLKLGRPLLGEEEKPPLPTLRRFFRRFEDEHLATAVRETTRLSYKNSFEKYILPALGGTRLDEITRSQVKSFVASLLQKMVGPEGKEKHLARPSIRIILSELCALLNHALEDGLIQHNPARRLGKFYKQAEQRHKEIEPLTAEEVPAFLTAVLERNGSRSHYPLFLCAIHTGLRSGELAALKWGDIDWNGKFLTVRRSYVRGKVIEKTKTDKVHRVDISDSLLTALKELRHNRRQEWLKGGRNEIPEWVFCNREGNPADMHNVKNRHFFKCLEKAGLRRIRFHDLRHTFASLLIQNGESLAYVKDQLGHSSIKLTVDVYGHLVPGANREAVNRLPSLEILKSEPANCQPGDLSNGRATPTIL